MAVRGEPLQIILLVSKHTSNSMPMRYLEWGESYTPSQHNSKVDRPIIRSSERNSGRKHLSASEETEPKTLKRMLWRQRRSTRWLDGRCDNLGSV